MINRRAALGLLASAGTVALAANALAQPANKDGKEKKPKKHQSGSKLLGAKVKQNGKHKLAQSGSVDVEVEVKGGKVASLTAKHAQKGNLPVRKVKSKQRLAELAGPNLVLAAADDGAFRVAQYADWYYGYEFTDGTEDWYYWFTADEVYVDDTWVEYY
ncbi:hypothetical protein FQV39_29175 [Bosea sp. F3-2]|uniref:hypothetical protein n=1 Tax=Bosea sp. F3-2 TaxID=2599640 RepID=UPI0011ECBFAF|nr:hypothetical protein [Bosea sp. F3-2]QEL26223.1 hypothetical protein FQV39_29175 [Bosea sp. F3-2]